VGECGFVAFFGDLQNFWKISNADEVFLGANNINEILESMCRGCFLKTVSNDRFTLHHSCLVIFCWDEKVKPHHDSFNNGSGLLRSLASPKTCVTLQPGGRSFLWDMRRPWLDVGKLSRGIIMKMRVEERPLLITSGGIRTLVNFRGR